MAELETQKLSDALKQQCLAAVLSYLPGWMSPINTSPALERRQGRCWGGAARGSVMRSWFVAAETRQFLRFYCYQLEH